MGGGGGEGLCTAIVQSLLRLRGNLVLVPRPRPRTRPEKASTRTSTKPLVAVPPRCAIVLEEDRERTRGPTRTQGRRHCGVLPRFHVLHHQPSRARHGGSQAELFGQALGTPHHGVPQPLLLATVKPNNKQELLSWPADLERNPPPPLAPCCRPQVWGFSVLVPWTLGPWSRSP
jgi:hypothetical protein